MPASIEANLPAMLLYPDDFGIDGILGNFGYLFGPEEYAEFLSPSNSGPDPRLAVELDQAGFVGGAMMQSGVLSTTDPELFDISAGSLVVEYEDADGAETGFERAVAMARRQGSQDVDIPRIGDQSALIRMEQSILSPLRELVQLDLVFQIDRFVGTVGIAWFDDARSQELDAEDMTALADQLLERMIAVDESGDSGTALTILRLDGMPDGTIDWYQEQFDIRDREVVHMMTDVPEEMEPVIGFWEESGIDEIYRFSTGFTARDGGYLSYSSRAYDLGRSRAAERWVDDAVTFFVEEDRPGGYTDFGEIEELDGFDVDVVAVTYAWESEATGMRVWFPVDGIVYTMEADGPDGIDEETFFELIEMQIECAEDGGYCEPIPAPDELYR